MREEMSSIKLDRCNLRVTRGCAKEVSRQERVGVRSERLLRHLPQLGIGCLYPFRLDEESGAARRYVPYCPRNPVLLLGHHLQHIPRSRVRVRAMVRLRIQVRVTRRVRERVSMKVRVRDAGEEIVFCNVTRLKLRSR